MSSFHILAIRFSSMGDVLLQTSLIAAIKKKWGHHVSVSFVTAKEFTSLLSENHHIERVLSFQRGSSLRELVKSIKNLHRKQRIDLILDLHQSTRSKLLRCLLWYIPSLAANKRSFERKLLVKFKWNLLRNRQGRDFKQVHRNIKDFAPILRLSQDFPSLAEFIHPDNQQAKDQGSLTFINEHKAAPLEKFALEDKHYLCLCPSASFAPKRWPVERFYQLAEKILTHYPEYKLLILAGPEDGFCAVFNSLAEQYANRLINLQGKTTLQQTYALLSQSRLVVGNDTGLPHIAEAYGVPVITLFGPTSIYFGFGSHLKDSITISAPQKCTPCSTTGVKKCYRSEQFCFTHISVDQVYEQIKQQLLASKVEA